MVLCLLLSTRLGFICCSIPTLPSNPPHTHLQSEGANVATAVYIFQLSSRSVWSDSSVEIVERGGDAVGGGRGNIFIWSISPVQSVSRKTTQSQCNTLRWVLYYISTGQEMTLNTHTTSVAPSPYHHYNLIYHKNKTRQYYVYESWQTLPQTCNSYYWFDY